MTLTEAKELHVKIPRDLVNVSGDAPTEHKPRRIDLAQWHAQSKGISMMLATDPDLPLWLRIFELASTRRNEIGHAEFRPGELRGLLPDAQGRQPSREAVSRAIAQAKRKGYLDVQSCAACLVTHVQHVQGGSSRSTRCNYHPNAGANAEVVSLATIRRRVRGA